MSKIAAGFNISSEPAGATHRDAFVTLLLKTGSNIAKSVALRVTFAAVHKRHPSAPELYSGKESGL